MTILLRNIERCFCREINRVKVNMMEPERCWTNLELCEV